MAREQVNKETGHDLKPYYQDGYATIFHGDCREYLSPALAVDAVITDPPYGVGRIYSEAYSDDPKIYWDWFLPCINLMRGCAPVVAFTHRIHASKHVTDWDWIAVWHKPWSSGARIGKSPILPHWEAIFLYGIHTLGNKRDSFPDVISCNPEASPARPPASSSPRDKKVANPNGFHPLPKPKALFSFLISRLTDSTGIVLDPFMGSGTTLVAAKERQQKAIGIEIEEKYCEIAAKRLAQEVLPFASPVQEVQETPVLL